MTCACVHFFFSNKGDGGESIRPFRTEITCYPSATGRDKRPGSGRGDYQLQYGWHKVSKLFKTMKNVPFWTSRQYRGIATVNSLSVRFEWLFLLWWLKILGFGACGYCCFWFVWLCTIPTPIFVVFMCYGLFWFFVFGSPLLIAQTVQTCWEDNYFLSLRLKTVFCVVRNEWRFFKRPLYVEKHRQ